jgi:hypothetical protein
MFPKWILWFCVGLFGLFLFIGLYQWPPESDPQPSETPTVLKISSTKTNTLEPTKTNTLEPTKTNTMVPSHTFTPMPTEIPITAILYSEDFENENPENWAVSFGTFIVMEEDSNSFWQATGPHNYPQAWYISTETENWINYAFESRIRFIKGTLFICVRSQTPDAFYNSAISSDNWIHIAEFDSMDGEYRVIAETQNNIQRNKWYLIRVEVQGNNISLFIDNKLVLSAKSSSRAFGGIGYYLGGGEIIDIDDIRVWAIK